MATPVDPPIAPVVNPVGNGLPTISGTTPTLTPPVTGAPVPVVAPPTPTSPVSGPLPALSPVAPTSGYTATLGEAGVSKGLGYDATPYAVKPEGLVENRIAGILAKDSPLMQQARVNASQTMNQRGLLNSSLNTEAGQNAVISQAAPIANADAGAINAAMTNTANATNAASQFGAGALNTASSTNAQLLSTMNATNANAVNAAENMKAQAENARSLAFIDNNTKQSLAVLQAQNQQLLQANTNAGQMFTQTVQAIAAIMNDPNLDAATKTLNKDSLLNILNEGLRATSQISSTTQDAVKNLNLDQLFVQGTANTPQQIKRQRMSLQSAIDTAKAELPVWGQNTGAYTASVGKKQSERTAQLFAELQATKNAKYQAALRALADFDAQNPAATTQGAA